MLWFKPQLGIGQYLTTKYVSLNQAYPHMVYDLLVSNSFVDKPITLILGFFELISSSLDSE